MARNVHINVKEFIATLIGIWLEITTIAISYARILCLSDNNSAVGWLQKSNFDSDKQSCHDTVVRKMTSLLLNHEVALHPQYVKGGQNIIADSLSRDFQLSDKQLCFALTSLFPKQTSKDLTLLPSLPNDITSWVESLMDGWTNRPESLLAPTPSKVGALLDGNDSWPVVVSKINS